MYLVLVLFLLVSCNSEPTPQSLAPLGNQTIPGEETPESVSETYLVEHIESAHVASQFVHYALKVECNDTSCGVSGWITGIDSGDGSNDRMEVTGSLEIQGGVYTGTIEARNLNCPNSYKLTFKPDIFEMVIENGSIHQDYSYYTFMGDPIDMIDTAISIGCVNVY